MIYITLIAAIAFEVAGTTLLKASHGFSVLAPTLGSLFLYGCSFYFLSLCMQSLPTGLVYAIWSGVGIVLISLAAYFIYHQTLDAAALIGISMIVGGVVVIQLFSQSISH